MSLSYPSREFDDLVADVLHGTFTKEQACDLNELLLKDENARDEYLLRLELHGYLASQQDIYFNSFGTAAQGNPPSPVATTPTLDTRQFRGLRLAGIVAGLAACIALVALGLLSSETPKSNQPNVRVNAVAMLHKTLDAQWAELGSSPLLGASIEPGALCLETGVAQIVLYSGARIVLQAPAELNLISAHEVYCVRGRLGIEVPTQAKGFRVRTPHAMMVDEDSHFGLQVSEDYTEVQVFEGQLSLLTDEGRPSQELVMGSGAIVETGKPVRTLQASQLGYEAVFELQRRSQEADELRYRHWQEASERLNEEPSLLVHFNFEKLSSSDWQLANVSRSRQQGYEIPPGAIVGCQWTSGRWSLKSALGFNSMNDRVGVNIPAVIGGMTLSSWIRVQGLDRQFNSLFMCRGFEPGTVHWLIRNDGALGLTLVGPKDFQIVASPSVVTLEKFGTWIHVAVVVDAEAKFVIHYLNGKQVSQQPLKIAPPYRLGDAELGNWDSDGFQGHESTLIRNFSGAMDEFCLFSRALRNEEIQLLYESGNPAGGASQ